jgi:hypothetical protein
VELQHSGAGRCRRSSAVSGGELRAVNLPSISLDLFIMFRFATVREEGREKSDEYKRAGRTMWLLIWV